MMVLLGGCQLKLKLTATIVENVLSSRQGDMFRFLSPSKAQARLIDMVLASFGWILIPEAAQALLTH